LEFIEILSNITWVSILLLILGMAFVVLELYTPGIGIPGFIGGVSLIAFIVITGQNAAQRMILTGILVVICAILFVVFFVLLSKRRLPKSLILDTSEKGFTGSEDRSFLLGKTGVVLSTCRPAGNADFDGLKLDIVSRGEFIEKDRKIEVIEIEGNRIVVKEVE
jgi:membrane-bound ClpP family serine protease